MGATRPLGSTRVSAPSSPFGLRRDLACLNCSYRSPHLYGFGPGEFPGFEHGPNPFTSSRGCCTLFKKKLNHFKEKESEIESASPSQTVCPKVSRREENSNGGDEGG
ncbi:hypothetical protein V6N11_008494 [Hibiscus sabdariffa]|uniref:Uncharacterized protein n=1 Tax=Hibiscus sabdariffa TaxID=183260 RepID=A0ABR1ZV88_9ROSI